MSQGQSQACFSSQFPSQLSRVPLSAAAAESTLKDNCGDVNVDGPKRHATCRSAAEAQCAHRGAFFCGSCARGAWSGHHESRRPDSDSPGFTRPVTVAPALPRPPEIKLERQAGTARAGRGCLPLLPASLPPPEAATECGSGPPLQVRSGTCRRYSESKSPGPEELEMTQRPTAAAHWQVGNDISRRPGRSHALCPECHRPLSTIR